MTVAISAAALSCGGDSTVVPLTEGGVDATPIVDAGGDPDHVTPPADARGDEDANDANDANDAGNALASAHVLFLWGVTTDGYVVYEIDENVDGAQIAHIFTIAATGGPSTEISRAAPYQRAARVNGNAVLVGRFLHGGAMEPLSVWTAASGLRPLVANAPYDPYRQALAPDGAHVVFAASPSGTDGGTQGSFDFDIANVDGSGLSTLVAGATTGRLYVAGSYVLATYTRADGVILIESWLVSTSGVTRNVLYADSTSESFAGGALRFDGQTVAFSTVTSTQLPRSGNVYVVPIAGGAPTRLATGAQSASLELGSGGTVAYYMDVASGGLYRTPTTGPAPTQLIASGLSAFAGLSPDGAWTTIATPAVTSGRFRVSVASTISPGTPFEVISDAMGLGYIPAEFLADSSRAWVGELDSNNVPRVALFPLPSGSPKQTIDNSNALLSLGGAKVVYASGPDQNFLYSIYSQDLATTNPRRVIEATASGLALFPAHDRLAYVASLPNGDGALKVATVP